MPKFTVKSPLNHDNKRYEPGSTVDLDDATAEPLLAVDVIEPAAEKKAEKAK